ncbi:MAG TPA: helix-turn-helix domain-containing protein [Candidatus Sulfotelmatobacter sp.]|nr:helix-turn-helix domain-containing protein [Candidatus Sulfotelmatobacter sp.]
MQTIGERLEEARKKRGISIREAAEATKIRGEYLQKFEGNQFEIGLTDIYTRGFLRGYANYLRIPSDRLLSDFTALRGGEPRVRQPSREVYGRMDLAISSADERGEPKAESSASESSPRPQPRFQRPGENLPKGPAIDPALVFKGGILLVGLLGLAVAIWIVKTLFGPVPGPAGRGAAPAMGEQVETAVSAPAASVAIVALEPVRIKVVRKSDGVELFQGPLRSGERREYPNVPIYLTATDLGAVELDYKGHRYPTGHSGHERIQFDFSNR